jgi:general secretion pathway protein G
MVVIVILGLLVGIVGPNVYKRLEQGKTETTKAQLSQLENAIMTYQMMEKRFPGSLSDIATELQGEELPTDGWGKDFVYEPPSGGSKKFELYSCGPDGEMGTEDDIKLSDLRKTKKGGEEE